MTRILVLNAGSSSLKFAAFDRTLARLTGGTIAGLGGGRSHEDAVAEALIALRAAGLDGFAAVGHRIVHGGPGLSAPAEIGPAVRAEIEAAAALAPLHNPPALAALDAAAAALPGARHVAVFDTAFHATAPETARRFALPEEPATAGLRRYGFHGISYAGLVAALPALSGAPLPRRLLALHLGAGASLCAVLDGRSVAATMGFSPLSGLSMATRAGDVEADAALLLAERIGVAAARELLTRRGGLAGLSGGVSDMRALLESDDPRAGFAVDHFVARALREAGAMAAAMGGLDALAFTGGIGENAAPIRARIVAGLGFLGAALDPAANEAGGPRLHPEGAAVAAWIVRADEERTVAAAALRLLG